eukprot:3590411-Amphidinium_carterae.1
MQRLLSPPMPDAEYVQWQSGGGSAGGSAAAPGFCTRCGGLAGSSAYHACPASCCQLMWIKGRVFMLNHAALPAQCPTDAAREGLC